MSLFVPKVVLLIIESVTPFCVHGVSVAVTEACAYTYHRERFDIDNLQHWSCILLFSLSYRFICLLDYLTCNIVLHAVLDNHDVVVLNELALAR